MKKWTSDFDFQRDILKFVPMWVRLYNLLLNCWGVDALNRIASILGTPVCANETTSQQNRASYARLLVKVDLTQPLVEELHVERVSRQLLKQRVTFEWKPMFCTKCLLLGHKCEGGPTRYVQKWVPKNPVTPQQATEEVEGVVVTPEVEEVEIQSESQ